MAVAHRGGAALGAENTVQAFQRAVDMGFRYLETDVRMTSDGVCVAFHDRDLSRVTGTRGTIDALTWREAQQVTVLGSGRVPRLEELLRAWPHARWILDIKQPSALPTLAEIVREARATDRVCLAGAWDAHMARARELLGHQVATTVGWRELARLITATDPRPNTPTAATFAHVPLRFGSVHLPTPRLLARARERGLRLLVWGVDDTRQVHRLLDDGIDGIITDHTHLLRDALIARGQWHTAADPSAPRRAH